jgi:flagellar export protein FliJ
LEIASVQNMPSFRFRAQPALEMRRKQEELQRAAVNDARLASEAAEAALAAAQASFDDATARAHAADAEGGDVTVAIWHRNWIKSQRRELARCDAIAEDRRVQLQDAERLLIEARRRVRVLERLRERAWTTHQQNERRVEQQRLDELAVLRFAIRQRGESS